MNRMTGIAALAVLLFALGCGTTPPTVFYTLTPISDPPGDAPGSAIVGVGPVVLPDYLDRPQMVTRATAHRLEVDEFQRWGGSLEEDVARVLAQNLSLLLNSDRVRVYPGPERLDLTYRVFVEVRRFDGRPGEGVTLNAVWTLLGGAREQPLQVQRFHHQAPAPTPDRDGLVAAHSDALAALSREIAGAIQAR